MKTKIWTVLLLLTSLSGCGGKLGQEAQFSHHQKEFSDEKILEVQQSKWSVAEELNYLSSSTERISLDKPNSTITVLFDKDQGRMPWDRTFECFGHMKNRNKLQNYHPCNSSFFTTDVSITAAWNVGWNIATLGMVAALDKIAGGTGYISRVEFDTNKVIKAAKSAGLNVSNSWQVKFAFRNVGRGFPDQKMKSARKGEANAQFEVGKYFFGLGKYPEAVAWLEKAALQDHPQAQNWLGVRYSVGEGVTRDLAVAAQWYLKAAKQGNAHAQRNIGSAYWGGRGVIKNISEGTYWTRKAANQGNAEAQNSLGLAYYNGWAVKKSFALAHKWFNLASAKSKNDQYAKNMRVVERDMTNDQIRAAEKLAANWLPNKQAKTISQSSNRESTSGKQLIETTKIQELQKKAKEGDPDAQTELGLEYEYGNSVAKDLSIAVKWYRLAAEKGFGPAQHNLARMLEKGEGVAQDLDAAVKWYRKASESGMAPSRQYLKELLSKISVKKAQKPNAGSGGKFPVFADNFNFEKIAEKPNDIAVIIGNADYMKQGRDIPNIIPAYADAAGFKKWVSNSKGVRAGNIIHLSDATGSQMESVFGNERSHKGQLFNWTKPGISNVYIYYAGHGAPAGDGEGAFLVPTDADSATLELTSFRLSTLYKNLEKLPAKSITVVLESCFSGASQNGSVVSRTSGILVTPKVPSAPQNLTVISAGRSNQIASWEQDSSHSLFTKFFLKGMSGEADVAPYGDGDGEVNYDELGKYLDGTMTYFARRYYGRDQNAQIVQSVQ
jgi:TPR repeat protein